jgi:hypothetical protein
MQLIHFFITYFLFLLASSVVITAFFCITRGYTEVMPDGSERRYGKVLKGYFFFWFREKGKKKIFYVEDELAGLVNRIKEHYTGSMLLVGEWLVMQFETTENIKEVIPFLRNSLQVQFEIEEIGNGKVAVSAFKEEPDYVFPEWARTIMAGCITCTPTVYGNIIYWGVMYLLKKDILYQSLFNCFNNPYAGVIITWIAYWISLAWLNTVLWNIYDK